METTHLFVSIAEHWKLIAEEEEKEGGGAGAGAVVVVQSSITFNQFHCVYTNVFLNYSEFQNNTVLLQKITFFLM